MLLLESLRNAVQPPGSKTHGGRAIRGPPPASTRSEVIRAGMLEGSPYLPHGLCGAPTAPSPRLRPPPPPPPVGLLPAACRAASTLRAARGDSGHLPRTRGDPG